MAYTAFRRMRDINEERFGKEMGPFEPALYVNRRSPNGLKSAALRFLHNSCEGLRFDAATEGEFSGDKCTGRSFSAGQIPYNMQMDIDRLCLERELENFIDSGSAPDAYSVYYCFLEMFIGRYGASHSMIELLSEFEYNASSLLMKHRDHYSHSVYVFALGLAIYETNEKYRNAFRRFYKDQIGFAKDESEKSKAARTACFFLEYWGLAALFHDIGYPFEIPFEQVMSYFEVDRKKRGKGRLYLAYRDVEALTALSEEARARFREIYERDFEQVDELLAADITAKLGGTYGFDEEYMLGKLRSKPVEPQNNGYFMDHAYFSSARLCKELFDTIGRTSGTGSITAAHVDVLSAIMLHNSLFKFAVAFYKDPDRKPPLRASLHPLAYMLMICDELQCWDRTAYGRNSRTELHPMAADFDFSDGGIKAVYYYDAEESEKIDDFRMRYDEWAKTKKKLGAEAAGEAPRLKAYSDMNEKEKIFVSEIKHIVDTSKVPFDAEPAVSNANRKRKKIYLSDSNFLHLYDFAVSLNGRYNHNGKEASVKTEQLEKEFDEMSLEYKMSNLDQARCFSKYLQIIECFYTDKPVDFDMVTRFSQEELDTIAPLEHERWVREHIRMGWRFGDEYAKLERAELGDPASYGLDPDISEKQFRAALREQTRRHMLTMDGHPTTEEIKEHYDKLDPNDQGKDWKPMKSMLKLIRKYDGLRIYRLQPVEEQDK